MGDIITYSLVIFFIFVYAVIRNYRNNSHQYVNIIENNEDNNL